MENDDLTTDMNTIEQAEQEVIWIILLLRTIPEFTRQKKNLASDKQSERSIMADENLKTH